MGRVVSDWGEFFQGTNIPRTDVWLDPPHRVPFAVWCNPNIRGFRNQPKVVCTELAARLMGINRPSQRRAALVAPYGHAIRPGTLTITLHPAGFCLGDAQAVVLHEKRSYWYTGPRSTRSALLDPPDDPEHCQHIILATDTMSHLLTYDNPQHTLDTLSARIWDLIGMGITPIVLCAGLGDAQELAFGLHKRGLRHAATSGIRRYNEVYRQHGIALPDTMKANATTSRPVPILTTSTEIHQLDIRRFQQPQILSVGPNPPAQPQDWTIVDHVYFCRGPTLAELEGILTWSQPESIRVSGPFQNPVAAALQQRGWPAEPVDAQSQLQLL